MKKIGIYVRAASRMGGTFQYNMSIVAAAECIDNNKFSFLVAYSNDYWAHELSKYGLRCIYIRSSFFSRASAEIWGLLRLPVGLWRKLAPYFHPLTRSFIKQECDLWLFPSQDSLAYWIPVKSICSIHDLMHIYEPAFREVSSYFEFAKRERHYKTLVKWCEAILVDSKIGKNQVHESYDADTEKIFPLPYVPASYIYRDISNKEIHSIREKYQLPNRFFFYPAHYWRHKNHDNLIRAFRNVCDNNQDIFLVLSGRKQNNYNNVIRLIDSLGLSGKVLAIGYISNTEMPVIYHCAYALIMPTYFGPTNIPPLEAMVCRCPVAVSRIYGMPDQLGDAALYFDPNSIDEITDTMTGLLNKPDSRSQLIEKGIERSKMWNLERFSQRLNHIMDQIICSPNR